MPESYVPLAQGAQSRMHYAVRVAGDEDAALAAVRAAAESVDPDVPISRVAIASEIVAGTVSNARFFTSLLALFGALGLFLGAVGVYGVMAYAVAQRSHEIGVRLALGAGAREVLGRTLGQGLAPVGLGLLVGLPTAFLASRLLTSALYGVVPADPLTYVSVPFVLIAVSTAAIYLPARRASRVDPVRVLKQE